MSDSEYTFASDAAEKAATKASLTLADFSPGGSGSGGNVTKADVDEKVAERESGNASSEDATTGAPTSPSEAEAKEPDARNPQPDPGPQNPPPRDEDHVPDASLETAEVVGLEDGPSLRERDHLEGCPMHKGRVESFSTVAPKVVGLDGIVEKPARRVKVTRCVDCGGQRVED